MKDKVTPRFMNGKILMFAKIYLASFVYDMIHVLSYLSFIKCYLYLILTDTNDAFLEGFFFFIAKLAAA